MMMMVTIPSERPRFQVSKSRGSSKRCNPPGGLTEKGLDVSRDRGPVVDDGKRDLCFPARRFQTLRCVFLKAFEAVTHGRIDGPSEIVQNSPKRGDDTDDQTVTVIQKNPPSQRLSLVGTGNDGLTARKLEKRPKDDALHPRRSPR
jgi:hypothetical protein